MLVNSISDFLEISITFQQLRPREVELVVLLVQLWLRCRAPLGTS